MKWQLYVFIAFAIVSAICGLTGTVMYWTMIDALNRRRPANDQIPAAITSLKDFQWHLERGPFSRWRVLKEFHNQFPQSPLYFWSVGLVVCMITMFAVAAFTMIFTHWN